MLHFQIQLIKTDVTALKIHENYILAGIGSQMHIYDLKSNGLLRKDTFFDGLRIHGIEINQSGSHILLNAESELLLLKLSFKNLELIKFDEFLSIEQRIPINDWILATKWLQYNNFVTVTMHNNVEFYNNETLLIAKNSCDTKCILYCAGVVFDTLRDCIVLSGTVFSEILVWKPYFSGEVYHRLRGHEGVLFSISCLDSHILSTSDDRSITLWKIDGNLRNIHENTCNISIKHKMHGHTARVFCGKILTDYLLSAGEDGRVNIWDFDGNLIKTFNVHHGGSVWSLVCNESRNLIVSGGSDSSIARLPLRDNWQAVKIKIAEKEVPKKLIMLHNGDVVVIAESGILMHYIRERKKIVHIACFKEFQNYALMEASGCRRKVALAGLHGDIKVFSLLGNELIEEFGHRIPNKKRIFAIHWLTCGHLLTCGPRGVLYLWKLHKPSEKLLQIHSTVRNGLLLIGKYELPPSKERWSTSACRIPNLGIAVGDRKGNLHLFKMDDTAPSHTLKKAHSHLGITQLYWDSRKQLLTSFGRNSTLRKYHVTSHIIPITSDVLPFSWLGSKLKDENVILGFSGNNMLLWDYDKRLELFKSSCGGGHRSWDFLSDVFVYIRDKAVNCLKTNQPVELSSSIHSTEMNTMKCLLFPVSNKIVFISGGEDTTLRFSTSGLDKNKVTNLLNISTIKSHLSSIRCMHIVTCKNVNSNHVYELVTAGGRGQIIYWQLTFDKNGNFQFCKELRSFYKQEDEEVRVMDLTSIEINGEQYLFAACSDGSIKIYNLKNDNIALFKVIFYKLRCILKLGILSLSSHNAGVSEPSKTGANENCLLVTMATDGHLCFWKLDEVLDQKDESRHFFNLHVHLSGINSFDFKYLDKNRFCFLTGGDDNRISLLVCKYLDSSDGMTVLYHYKNVVSHCAQITGVYLGDEYFFTCSLDQKLLLFEYEVKNALIVNFKASHCSSISDIKGMNVFENDGVFDVVLYGLGLELIKINTV